MQIHVNPQRLKLHFESSNQLGQVGETGMYRPALSPVEKKMHALAKEWMEEAGMKVRLDNFGNLIGRLEGRDSSEPVLMVGSHLDTQPFGGRYDGVVGVLGAIEAVNALMEQGHIPNRPIEVVAFCDEEGWRFNKGLFGSRGILGKLEEGELQRKDKDGITRSMALREFGCNPERLADSVYPPGSIYAFLEMHIEQGPVLDTAGQPLGIVTGISGPLWLTVKLKGFAGHAGSVPMANRRDALVGAAEIIQALEQIVKAESGAPTVGTVGNLVVSPNSRNVIPEEVVLTIDLRDIDKERRDKRENELYEVIRSVAEKRNLSYEIRTDTNSEPRYCAEWIKDIIRTEGQIMGMDLPELMSGPFHDALALSYVCDFGMIFVRSKDGISHNPAEFSSYEDITLGTELLYRTIVKMTS